MVIPKGRNEKNTLRIGVVGFGKVGRACAELLLTSKDVALAAIVRRLDSLARPLPEVFSKIPVVSHTAQVHEMDAALLCVPIDQVEGVAHDCLQHGLPIIECALLHGEAFQAHREAINRFALVSMFRPLWVPDGIQARCPSCAPCSGFSLRRARAK